jgi:hypothetical protein
MPEAKPEFILNYSMNRWQLNFKRNVGPTSDSIRECQPQSYDEWEEYYFENVRTKQHLENLGERLFEKVNGDVTEENRFHPDLISCITEEMCIEYIQDVVLIRTYNGYCKEIGRV